MKRIIIVITILITLIAVMLLYYKTIVDKTHPDTWINLTIPDQGKIVYATDGLINDIPLPNIKDIKGDCKFIDRNDVYHIGYKIDLNILYLDTTKILSKYLQEKEVLVNGQKITALGLKEVTYAISFEFVLLDKNNFELMNIESATETATSGKDNEFQNIVNKSIPIKIIELTKKIKLVTSICGNGKINKI